jgi:hypothetical protein
VSEEEHANQDLGHSTKKPVGSVPPAAGAPEWMPLRLAEEQFYGTLASLQTLLRAVGWTLADLEEPSTFVDDMLKALRWLPDPGVNGVRQIFAAGQQAPHKPSPSPLKGSESTEDESGGREHQSKNIDANRLVSAVSDLAKQAKGKREVNVILNMLEFEILRLGRRPSRQTLLFSSVLVMGVSAFEGLVGALATHFYRAGASGLGGRHHPRSLYGGCSPGGFI